MGKVLALLIVALSVGAAAPARADNAQLARDHFAKGNMHYSVAEFGKAAEEYRAAYMLSQKSVILYNIAQSYRLAGNAEKAIFFYRSYLRNRPDAENRAEVEQRVAELESERARTKRPPPAVEPAMTTPAQPPPAKPEPPASTAVAPPAVTIAPPVLTTSVAPPERPTPVYKKWWLWTTVGVVVAAGVGLGVGLGLGLHSSGGAPVTDLGTRPVF